MQHNFVIHLYLAISSLTVWMTVADNQCNNIDLNSDEYESVPFKIYRSSREQKGSPTVAEASKDFPTEYFRVPRHGSDTRIKLFPELNKYDQKDERLISFLRNYVLIPPPIKCKSKDDDFCTKSQKRRSDMCLRKTKRVLKKGMRGQFHQATYVERLLKLENRKTLIDDGKNQEGKIKDEEGEIHTKPLNKLRNSSDLTADGTSDVKGSTEQISTKDSIPGEKFPKGGFYVEAGASDGEIISNSLYFEIKYKWSGLLIEPNPDFHDALVSKQRDAWILPHCLSTNSTPIIVDFLAATMLSGIIDKDVDSNEKSTIPSSNVQTGRTIRVQCFPIYSVLKAIGNPKVDYFSLDIEGAELQVLQTIPWNLVDINLFGIETEHGSQMYNRTEKDIERHMEKVGYNRKEKIGLDMFFIRK